MIVFFRQPLDPGLKLANTLIHMATGATFRQSMYSFRVADNTISKFIQTVLEAIVDTFQAEVLPPLIEPYEWRKVIDRFNTKTVEFPSCFWCPGWQAYSYQGPTKIWITLLQLHGILLHDPSSIGRCQLQVHMGISGEVWLSIRLPSVQRFRIKGVGRMW